MSLSSEFCVFFALIITEEVPAKQSGHQDPHHAGKHSRQSELLFFCRFHFGQSFLLDGLVVVHSGDAVFPIRLDETHLKVMPHLLNFQRAICLSFDVGISFSTLRLDEF